MKTFVGSFAAALVFFALPLAAEDRADKPKDEANKPKDEAKSLPAPPRAVYQHSTSAGRPGKFELNEKQGKADYYFSGQHHKDDLVYARSTEMRDPSLQGPAPGWVYQVSREGKKISIWFYFGANPLTKDGDRYVMSYTTTAPGPDGKQPWTRILTPGGTKRTPLEKKKDKGDDKEK
jgi:hypothetical protein